MWQRAGDIGKAWGQLKMQMRLPAAIFRGRPKRGHLLTCTHQIAWGKGANAVFGKMPV